MKPQSLMNEFMCAAKEGPRIYLAPFIGAYQAIKNEISPTGAGRVSIKTGVEVSVMPVGKRKR